MPEALIHGGTGQIGRAVGSALTDAGWRVRVLSRSAAPQDLPCAHLRLDPTDPEALHRAVGNGVDLLLDCVAYDRADADRLVAVSDRVGRLVAISSASVYCDDAGRTFDEAAVNGFPELPVPVPEDHPTVPPGPETYSTRKIAMEQQLRSRAACPVTILRPAAIHGPHSRHAREWWVVKRLLDGRQRIPLAHRGLSRFHTTSTVAIARAVGEAAAGRAAPTVNVVDGDAPTVADITTKIIAHLGREAELVPLDGPPGRNLVGKTPWSTARPLVYASSLHEMPRHAETVGPALDWLLSLDPADWRRDLPILAAYPRNHFDYAAEDRLLG